LKEANMRTVIVSIIIAGLLVLLGGFTAIYAGVYDVAATEPHWPVTRWILETARVRAIKAHAAGIQAPAGLDDPAEIPTGVEHYAAHCAVCHGLGLRYVPAAPICVHQRGSRR
jgi:hypothetical protein